MMKLIITTLFLHLDGLLLFAHDLRLELYPEGRNPNYRDVGKRMVTQKKD